MAIYTPDIWVVLELTGNKIEGGPLHKILAGWYGGYLGSDSWKLNSGISEIVVIPAAGGLWPCYEVHGHSGSTYKCHEQVERFSGLTRSIFADLEKQNCNDFSVTVVEMKDILEKYSK